MCDECRGIYANCPICGEERKTVTCPKCDGTGITYYDVKGKDLTQEQAELYAHFNVWYGEEKCCMCNGEKEIEIE
jgi:hypothetical protein